MHAHLCHEGLNGSERVTLRLHTQLVLVAMRQAQLFLRSCQLGIGVRDVKLT